MQMQKTKNLDDCELVQRISHLRPNAIKIAELGGNKHFYVCFEVLDSFEKEAANLVEKIRGSIFREKELSTMSEVPQNQQQPSMKAWYEQLVPYLPNFIEQLLGIISRMIGVQISAATNQMKADIVQMRMETEAIRKQQEQMLRDFDAKISEKTASLGTILSALSQAGAFLQQVKK